MVFQPYDPNVTIRWYDEHSKRYDTESFGQNDDQYGGDLYRIALVRQLIAQHKPKKILDVGCGTAEPLLHVLEDGFDIVGFDFSPGMIAVGKQKLKERGYSESLVEVGDLLDPGIVARYGEGKYDAVIANGILPYIPERERPHTHLAALVKPGGLYISAYSNALLDLTTFNRFTLKFHIENFIKPLGLPANLEKDISDNLAKLMTHPDLPTAIPEGATIRSKWVPTWSDLVSSRLTCSFTNSTPLRRCLRMSAPS
jgi:SAM-dependent methyltransferase